MKNILGIEQAGKKKLLALISSRENTYHQNTILKRISDQKNGINSRKTLNIVLAVAIYQRRLSESDKLWNEFRQNKIRPR